MVKKVLSSAAKRSVLVLFCFLVAPYICNTITLTRLTLTKALAQIGLFVNEDFGRDHISKRHKHLQKILVPKLLWQVVDEQIGALWPYSI